MKKINYTKENLLNKIGSLNQAHILFIHGGMEKIGIESIRALEGEYIFIGLYGAPDKSKVFPKPILGGEINYQENAPKEMLLHIEQLIESLGDSFSKENAYMEIRDK